MPFVAPTFEDELIISDEWTAAFSVVALDIQEWQQVAAL
jgi:hypothetical protein